MPKRNRDLTVDELFKKAYAHVKKSTNSYSKSIPQLTPVKKELKRENLKINANIKAKKDTKDNGGKR